MKHIIIKKCLDCTNHNNLFSYGDGTLYFCRKKLILYNNNPDIDYFHFKVIENPETIPDWCPLEDYKEKL